MKNRSLPRIATVICFMVSVIFLGQISTCADEIKPIHEYNFDSDHGSVAVDTAKNNAKNGIANGASSNQLITGYNETGNARNFNGVDDYISFDNPIIPIGAKSIRFKVKKDASAVANTDRWESILSTHDDKRTDGFYIGIGPNYKNYIPGSIVILITNSSSDIFVIQTPSGVCDGKWHDILFTWDGTTNTNSVKLYLDDMTTPVAETTPTSTERINGNNLSIGSCDFTGPGKNVVNFNGNLDNIQIYDSVIPTAAVDPGQSTGNRALLVITMVTGERKEYEMSIDKINDFVAWHNSKADLSPTYVIEKDYNKALFTSRKDYIAYDQISNFEVNEYEN